ncbi:nitroreductase family protein [Propionigenium maris]|nr:nitroreductase family protein [Propionigenium maris]
MMDTLMGRRSIRKYQDKTVEGEKVRTILAAGRMAPSGKNKKPWEFIVAEDRDTMLKLSQVKPKGGLFVKDAPMGIVVVGDEEKSDTWVEDCSIASTFMQLEAHNQGLGSCWVQFRGRFTPEGGDAEVRVREILGIEEGRRVLCVITLGYPNEVKPPYKEEDYY